MPPQSSQLNHGIVRGTGNCFIWSDRRPSCLTHRCVVLMENGHGTHSANQEQSISRIQPSFGNLKARPQMTRLGQPQPLGGLHENSNCAEVDSTGFYLTSLRKSSQQRFCHVVIEGITLQPGHNGALYIFRLAVCPLPKANEQIRRPDESKRLHESSTARIAHDHRTRARLGILSNLLNFA